MRPMYLLGTAKLKFLHQTAHHHPRFLFHMAFHLLFITATITTQLLKDDIITGMYHNLMMS